MKEERRDGGIGEAEAGRTSFPGRFAKQLDPNTYQTY
jgi:hypothetical protein